MGDPQNMARKKESEDALILAKAAEQAERYEDMVKHMKKLLDDEFITGDVLTNEERNLISVGYKNVMSSRRTSFRTIANAVDTESDPAKKELLTQYKNAILDELSAIIAEVSGQVPSATPKE